MSNFCNSNNFVSAVIVAAGKSTRMNMSVNKQFISLENMPVLAHTIKTFQNTTIIDEIVIVVNEDDIRFVHDSIVSKYSFSKVIKVVSGGSERQTSVYNGILNVNPSTSIITIHDGARPFVSSDIIIKTIEAAKSNSSAVCAVKVKDTIKTSTLDGFIEQTLERDSLWSIQTPQAFSYDVILKAHTNAIKENFIGTDDAVLVEKLGIKTKIVPGSYTNIKITTSEDLAFSEAILKNI